MPREAPSSCRHAVLRHIPTVCLPQASMVHTTETVRIRYFMDLLMEKQRPVMLVGNAGTGKTVLMWDKLEALNTQEYLVQSVPFNFYTTSAMLQGKGCPQLPLWGLRCASPWPTLSALCSHSGEAPGEEVGEELWPTRH